MRSGTVVYFLHRKISIFPCLKAVEASSHLALLEKKSGKYPRVILEIFSTFSPLFLQIYVFILTI